MIYIFSYFSKKTWYGYALAEALLMSTHNGHGSTRPETNSAPGQLGRVNSACFVGYTNTLSEHTYLFNYSLINIYFMT